MTQSCGNCGWWAAWRKGNNLGSCCVPLPDCITTGARDTMRDTDGTTCPCHKKKEGE